MSQAKATSSPPPKANPSMAATTGMGRLATSLTLARNPATKGPVSSLVILALSFKSAPIEQKCIINIGTAGLFSRKKKKQLFTQ